MKYEVGLHYLNVHDKIERIQWKASIIASNFRSDQQRKIKESMMIKQIKPNLNKQGVTYLDNCY